MRRSHIAGTVLAVMASSMMLVGSASATVRQTTASPKVLSCAGTAQFKPTSIILSCADANSILKSIYWDAWSATKATGIAVFSENTCQPTCVAGKVVSYKATVELSKPTKTKLGLLFSSISYTYGITTSQSLPLTKL